MGKRGTLEAGPKERKKEKKQLTKIKATIRKKNKTKLKESESKTIDQVNHLKNTEWIAMYTN